MAVRRLVAVLAVLCLSFGCANTEDPSRTGKQADTTVPKPRTTWPVRDIPDGPSARATEIPDGAKAFNIASLSSVPEGYVQREFLVEGRAVGYAGQTPGDGGFTLTPSVPSAEYRVRVLVLEPKAGAYTGTALLEWANVSAGIDTFPETLLGGSELFSGHLWVGASVQHIGVEGGLVAVSPPQLAQFAGKGLKRIDPGRYSNLTHPGDVYAFDIYTQIGRLVRGGGLTTGRLAPPKHLIAMGESQSASELVTYANGVHPLTRVFDGYFIHSRGKSAMPLGEPGKAHDVGAGMAGPPVRIRGDLDVPVFMFQTETDVYGFFGYAQARQPDSDRVRTWEVAGTAHTDRAMLGPVAENCPVPVNSGPQRFVLRAALAAMVAWTADGVLPPTARPLEYSLETGQYKRDVYGNAYGGVRTPQVDVAVDVLKGEAPPNASLMCLLAGTTQPIPKQALQSRYPAVGDYELAYRKALDTAIERGFVRRADRDQVISEMRPQAVG